MENVKLSPPWDEYVRKVMSLFAQDEEIHIESKDAEMTIYVDNTDKYVALTKLLPETKSFGNVELTINIVPANNESKQPRDYIRDLFKNNGAVTQIEEVKIGTNPMIFVEFEKEVVQYYNDNIGDLHGNRTTVMEEIAREVFENLSGVSFCTDNAMPY